MADGSSDFWRLFTRRAAELAATSSADTAVYDDLLAALQRIDPGLWLEFSASKPGACELIVSAEGDRALFPRAREVVASAPAVPGWTIRALKPRLGLPVRTSWEGFTVEIGALVFEPLQRSGSDELGLRVFVPGLAKSHARAAHAAIVRALDHGLGEERFAEAVDRLQVAPLPEGARREDCIPLEDLERYLDWRERKRARG